MLKENMVPRPRGRLPVVCAVLLFSLLFVPIWLHDAVLTRETSGLVLFTLILGETLHSLCLFPEEWLFHSRQRYGGRFQKMLSACFSRSTVAGTCVVISLLLVGGFKWTHDKFVSCALTCAFYLLLKAFGVLGPTPVEILEVCESRKLNVAHGLAWSYYLGYLKFVIPELENQIKKHKTLTGQDLHSARLHILLPLSAAAPAKIEEEDQNIHFHTNLPELKVDRAGVRGRVFKHSIYKIRDDKQEEYYCVVEYATPLLTLYHMSQDSTAGFSEQDRRQQVLLFYRTLSHILESSLECRNRYRLILLDNQQVDIHPHYVSTDIIKHLQQEKREIPMDLPQDLPEPVPEQGGFTPQVHYRQQEEPLSSLPSLMISAPQSLRSEPEENTDYTNNHQNRRR
ncbi:stimulator of interferon genes protein [Clarias gariepinus]|uniref:stimulator of interferon genes protein n=1 Tax=Clarias gariepinus TaxID=13013 RepID=UPI00234C993D|nr:stimulator of interferon genes protein [Clarias gariepinus]XP_053369746.1 stimulator of interferon genes protein [Clarias gariepinus]